MGIALLPLAVRNDNISSSFSFGARFVEMKGWFESKLPIAFQKFFVASVGLLLVCCRHFFSRLSQKKVTVNHPFHLLALWDGSGYSWAVLLGGCLL